MKKSIWSVMTLLFFLASLGLVFGSPEADRDGKGVVEVFSERSPGMFDFNQYKRQKQELYDRLMGMRLAVPSAMIHRVSVTLEEKRKIEEFHCESCNEQAENTRKVRVGVVKTLDLPVSFTAFKGSSFPVKSRQHAHGVIRGTADGGFRWTTAVRAIDARGIRVQFEEMYLPPRTRLYIFNDRGEAFGPYMGRGPLASGDFWSHTLSGSLAYIQLNHVGEATESELAAMRVTLKAVGYIGQQFWKKAEGTPKASSSNLCSFNAECVVDASCYTTSDWPAIDDARYGVAHIQFVSGPWIYICSGGLLADSDTSTQIPYFLTANHCISREKEADSLECYWQFWTSSCGAGCYDPEGNVPRTLGADILSTDKSADYCFMQLNESPPSGSVFLGWTTADAAYNEGMGLYRISHPQGAPQAYSHHQVDTSAGTCRSWPRGEWIYSRDVEGATEGGSSGSPVLNASGQVVGQLSGACGTNVNDTCDSVNNATVDGAFAAYFAAVETWLAGGTSNTAPTVTIDAPADGSVFDEGAVITFSGSASDSEDGDLSASLVWTSDLDGQIGTGATFDTTLSVGTHTVTAEAQDSGGLSGSDSITVTVGSGGIVLTATGYRVKGVHHVDLSWSGAVSTNVLVYRDGVLVATTANDGSYTDNTGQKGGATYQYVICEEDGSACSNTVTVQF